MALSQIISAEYLQVCLLPFTSLRSVTVGSGRMGGAPPLPSEGVGGGFYKQLDIPSVVAMAVSTEIITLRIVFHFSFFIRSNFLNFNF